MLSKLIGTFSNKQDQFEKLEGGAAEEADDKGKPKSALLDLLA